MNGMELLIVAIGIYILAVFCWKLMDLPFISPRYGVGEEDKNSLEGLFENSEKRKEVPIPHRSVDHSCGKLNSRLWNQPLWRDWLNKAEEQGAKIRVISGLPVDQNSEEVITEKIRDKKITLKVLKDRPDTHLLLIDERWLHAEFNQRGDVEAIPEGLKVRRLFPKSRKKFCGSFETLWDEGKLISLENISEIFPQTAGNNGENGS